jgi:DNA polymerase-4
MQMEPKKIWFHVDVNSAFLSWEAVWRLQHGSRRDLRDIPSVVGGNQATRHGIVLAKSIPAKKRYGVKTGEPLAAVRRRAPDVIIVPPRYDAYVDASEALVDMMRRYSPRVQRFSIDEAFLDYTGMQRCFGPPVEAARELGQRIREELGFTVNIGVSVNKLLSKMASEFEKPDRVHTLFPDEIREKLWPLPVDALYMVGRRTADKLRDRGIWTIGDLARQDPERVHSWLKGWGVTLWNFANGRYVDAERQGAAGFGGIAHGPQDDAKGMGNSGTIAFDVTDANTAHKALLALSETVGARLRAAGRRTRLISVSLVTSDFRRFGRQHKIGHPTNATTDIFREAARLFDLLWQGDPIRQLGVWSGELESQDLHQQTSLLSQSWKLELADRAVDRIRMRYGDAAIQRACFIGSEFNPMMGGTGSNRNFPAVSEGVL